jgi:hypothetical protein
VSGSTAPLGDIDAPIDLVWSVLTDAAAYPEWNPFMVSLDTGFEVGSPVVMRVHLLTTFPQRGTVTGFGPHEIRWRVLFGPAWFVEANRVQRLTTVNGRTRYETRDEMTGAAAPLVIAATGRLVARGFADMAVALKSRAESLA